MDLSRGNVEDRDLPVHRAGDALVGEEAAHREGLRPRRRIHLEPTADADTVGAGIPRAEEDGVRVGQETQRLREVRGRASVLPKRGIRQHVHAEDEQRAPGLTGHGYDSLQDGRGRCHARGPGDDREKGFVETRLTGAHLQLGPTRHMIQAVSECGEDPVVRQADGESHGHAKGHA